MKKLEGKVVLITGADGKIALAFAKLAIEENVKAVFLSGKDDGKGSANASSLGPNCFFVHLNVTIQEDWEKVISLIQNKFGHLDVLVNNASISGAALYPPMLGLEDSSLSAWKTVMNNNLDSIFIGCQQAIKLMKGADNASIVNIGSRSSLVARPNRMAYGAAKAGVSSLTKSVAIYCLEKGYNIRCNIILPSTILTEMWNPILSEKGEFKDDKFQEIADRIPMKRFGTAEEVANVILFLACEDSSYLTGTEIIVDGGAQALDALRSQIES